MLDLDAIAAPGSGERQLLDTLDLGRLPRHIAFIMDGNGRWAEARQLPRVEGHRAGMQTVRRVVETCARLQLDAVTLYAFSTENWKRPRHEIRTLMSLLKDFISSELDTFRSHNLRFRPIGRLDGLDLSVRAALDRAVAATRSNTGATLQVALNYSGRQEITDMVRHAAAEAATGRISAGDVDEDWVAAHLATADLPDPDLMVRTSGEQRISNFLLWQLAYAELYFCAVPWPDFQTHHLLEALHEYQRRERRYGGLSTRPTAREARDGAT
jgi:undecaprenyl diphosphate synthase